MFVKLQLFDATHLNIGISQQPSQKISPTQRSGVQKVLKIPNGEFKKFNKFNRQTHVEKTLLVEKPLLDENGHAKNPLTDPKRKSFDGSKSRKEEIDVGFEKLKANASCSTKWVNYGGSIPSMLEALDRIRDLDEALKPWEETLSNKERSIILKEQLDWERALEIFEWFKKKGCYELNVIHYNIILRILGKARKWGEVERLWDEMVMRRIVPINSTYGTLIDVYSKGGRKEDALRWLGRMYKQGMEPDEVTMGIVVQTYKKAGEFEKAEQFFKNWSAYAANVTTTTSANPNGSSQTSTSLSSYSYNTMIDTYGKAGRVKEATDTFEQMLREGIVPNTVTFNTMIHVYGNHGQLEQVTSLMQKMEELHCSADTRTYNILISLHAKHNNIDIAAGYFTKMKEASLDPDLVSYRTLLYAFSIRHMVAEAEELVSEMDEEGLEIDEFTQSALTRMYIEADLLEKSWLWFWRFHVGGSISSECYSANIDAYGERGHVLEAEKAFSCCQEAKKLTVLAFNVMIKAYGIGRNYDKACQLLDSMEKHGVLPDKCSYNSLIQMLASADLPHIARVYVRKMQEAGLVSDCVPYCAVISSFVKRDQLEKAEEVLKEMIRHDIQSDVIVYGVMINAYADIGSVKEGMYYADAMRKAGFSGNAVIYNSLIKLYTKVGFLKEAEETYKMLQSTEAGPDVYTSNCMIDLYSRWSMVKEAEEIFENLKTKGDANEFSFAMMLCMYKKIGRFEDAILIAKKMRELGLLHDLLSYNNVLGLYALEGRFKEAVGTFKEMIESAVEPDDSTFKSLGFVLMKCGVSKEAVGKMELTRKKDSGSGLRDWVSTLSAMVDVDDDDDSNDA
ncbi:Pentatricopeptide repeat [Dillenia turbinata]|uniref:Pentatricopeptide repeat n=1 Tax=Dillenia turbinata TaxID=194707 RepID=A0AAN8UHB3_9MAGN